MKNRRLTSIFYLTAASVFLFFCLSCGIPTYIVPKITFTDIPSTAQDNADSFTVNYSCEDELGDSGKVGLILLYHVEVTEPKSNSSLISKFKSTFVPTEYNGVDINVREGEPVLSSSDLSVYAFSLDGSLIADPEYTYELPNDGDFLKHIKLDYKDGKIDMTVSATDHVILSLDPATSASENQYIGIYAAVSVKSIRYTNHYWSDLKFVGAIRIVGQE